MELQIQHQTMEAATEVPIAGYFSRSDALHVVSLARIIESVPGE